VKAGKLTVVFRARKTRHFSGFIFEGFPFWEFRIGNSAVVVAGSTTKNNREIKKGADYAAPFYYDQLSPLTFPKHIHTQVAP